MKTISVFFFTTLLTSFHCTTEPSKQATEFIVKVDSLTRSTFASAGDTITLRLYGTIGNDGCHSFSRFEANSQPLRLDLAVWGQRTGSDVCPAVMVYLNGKEYKFLATSIGVFSFNIHQPDGTVLQDSLAIK